MTKEEFLKREKELFGKTEDESYRKFMEENVDMMDDDDVRKAIMLRHYESHVRMLLRLIPDSEYKVPRSISNYEYLLQENMKIAEEACHIRHAVIGAEQIVQAEVYMHLIALFNSIAETMKRKDTTIKNLIEFKEKKDELY